MKIQLYTLSLLYLSTRAFCADTHTQKVDQFKAKHEQLRRLKQMSKNTRRELKKQNPFTLQTKKIDLDQPGGRRRSNSCVGSISRSTLAPGDICPSNNNADAKKRTDSRALLRSASLKRVQELLKREEQKKAYEKTLKPIEQVLFNVFGQPIFDFIQASNTLALPLKKKIADAIAQMHNLDPEAIDVINEKIKSDGLRSVLSLLDQYALKQQFDALVTPQQRYLFKTFGAQDYAFIFDRSALSQVFLQFASQKEHEKEMHMRYTAYLRHRLKSLSTSNTRIETLRSVASSSAASSEEAVSPRSLSDVLSQESEAFRFKFSGVHPKEQEWILYDIIGPADFEYVKQAKGLTQVLIKGVQALFDNKQTKQNIAIAYRTYLREKVRKKENEIQERSPRQESPRSVEAIIAQSVRHHDFSPRRLDAPSADHVNNKRKKAIMREDGSLAGLKGARKGVHSH